MKHFISFLLLFLFSGLCAQNTVGVLTYDDENSAPGYNLFFSHNQSTVYLIDACGQVVHEWTDADNFRPGNAVYLLENGNLVKCKRKSTSAIQDPIWAGGGGETVEVRSWDNVLISSFTRNDSLVRLHHDVAPMPNGNILMVAWENRSREESIAAGRDPELLTNDEVWSLLIMEWNPSIDSIVWEWRAWDHLVQDYSAQVSNFGVVSEAVDRIDLNYGLDGRADWLHTNSIDYNPVLDQIVVSVPHFDELWVIDHSTTTEEAASSGGGLAGKGGDLLYRWGNPFAYERGDSMDRQLFFQHDVHWINPFAEEGDEDFGKLLFFNNRLPDLRSTANIIQTPLNGFNYEIGEGLAFGPDTYEKTISHPEGDIFSYSVSVSSAQKLENDNFLVFSGRWGFGYEVTPDNELAWEYRVPIQGGSVVSQGDTIGITDNLTFRMKRFSPDYPAFAGRNLNPIRYLENEPNEDACDELTPVNEISNGEWGMSQAPFPNPVIDVLSFTLEDNYTSATFFIHNADGKLIKAGKASVGENKIDLRYLEKGLYFLRLDNGFVTKLVKL